MHGKKTLNLKGATIIDMQKSTANTKRTECAAMMTTSGKLYLIFQGKPSGRIVAHDFPNLPQVGILSCQKMHDWMNT